MAALILFATLCLTLLSGYPVALVLAGVSLAGATAGIVFGHFDTGFLIAVPSRIFGIMNNTTLIAVPLFVFMGVMLERSRLAQGLLEDLGILLGRWRGGGALAVVAVGALLAASTGIVGATVVTLGLLSLPVLLKNGYQPALAGGTITAVGTLGQIIPPSIALILLGDVLSTAYQSAQLSQGIFAPKTVSVGDLFAGALLPGLLLSALYAVWIVVYSHLRKDAAPPLADSSERPHPGRLLMRLMPPLLLILLVLGSILAGAATSSEAAGIGAFGACLLAAGRGRLTLATLKAVSRSTLEITSMVFLILIGAAMFSLVFRGYGGDILVEQLFAELPGSTFSAMLLVMAVVFALGFVLDFIEITYVVVPIVAPALLAMGLDPIWLGIMLALNLQTSFLTPPFGFALFYLRGVAPPQLTTAALYRGVTPFIGIQLLLILLLATWPPLATWLPEVLRN